LLNRSVQLPWLRRITYMNPTHHFHCPFAVVLAALAFTACQAPRSRFAADSQGTMVAETTDYAGGRTSPAYEGAMQPDGIARSHGRYYYVHNGQGTRL